MLGDSIERALRVVGITENRVRAVLGECNCRERRDRLNALHAWAARVLAGKLEGARGYFERIVGGPGTGG